MERFRLHKVSFLVHGFIMFRLRFYLWMHKCIPFRVIISVVIIVFVIVILVIIAFVIIVVIFGIVGIYGIVIVIVIVVVICFITYVDRFCYSSGTIFIGVCIGETYSVVINNWNSCWHFVFLINLKIIVVTSHLTKDEHGKGDRDNKRSVQFFFSYEFP